MNKTLIILLLIVLILLVILNHLSIYLVIDADAYNKGCSATRFGCCPDGVNSKANNKGTNCPRHTTDYPGYPYPTLPPQVNNAIRNAPPS